MSDPGGQEREALEAALEFIQTVERWKGSDPDEVHELIAQLEAAAAAREDTNLEPQRQGGEQHAEHQGGQVRHDQGAEGAQLGGVDRAGGPIVDRVRRGGSHDAGGVPGPRPGDGGGAVEAGVRVDGPSVAAREETPPIHYDAREVAARGQDPTIEEAIDLLRELGADLGRFYNPDKGEPPHLEAIERVCVDLSNTFLPAREDTKRQTEALRESKRRDTERPPKRPGAYTGQEHEQ